MQNVLCLFPRSMTTFVFLKAFLALLLLSFEWILLPLFQYSAEVIKPHLLWHCESAELDEQFQLYGALSLLHRKHHLNLGSGLSFTEKDIIIIKAMLDIPKETEKNLPSG